RFANGPTFLVQAFMTRRSWNGSARCCMLLAGLITTFAFPRAGAAGQDAPPAPLVLHITPSLLAGPAVEHDDSSEQAQSGQQPETGRPRRDKPQFRWKSATLDYGRKARLNFKSRMRTESRTSDAAVTADALDVLDIPRR